MSQIRPAWANMAPVWANLNHYEHEPTSRINSYSREQKTEPPPGRGESVCSHSRTGAPCVPMHSAGRPPPHGSPAPRFSTSLSRPGPDLSSPILRAHPVRIAPGRSPTAEQRRGLVSAPLQGGAAPRQRRAQRDHPPRRLPRMGGSSPPCHHNPPLLGPHLGLDLHELSPQRSLPLSALRSGPWRGR